MKGLSALAVLISFGFALVSCNSNSFYKEWKDAGGIGIKFSTELNGKGFVVIDKLDQILDIL